MPLADLRDRIDEALPLLAAEGANLDARNGQEAVDAGIAALEARGVLVVEDRRVRVRDRIVLRYYARTIQHLLTTKRTTH
jgi:hypothetical protein